ncbi:hypothetical protein FACS1894184_14980 [Clostridia bacterium]|nr:hypothetical protein FACS1894184_14980 [Clostridia bacterium]
MRKLMDYTPTRFMREDSHYDKAAADHAVAFIESLCHTKGAWAGKPFELIDWQEQAVRDLFGVIKPNGYRQFNTAYIEIPKKQGKQISCDTLIPTPYGFTTMGDLNLGDIVFDVDGKTCHVVAKSAVDYDEAAFRITFKDGQVVDAGARHRWYGEWRKSNKLHSGTATTEWLYKRSKQKSREGSLDFRIPIASAVDLQDVSLPIEPYLYGYWLGNGHATKPEITIQTCDINSVLAQVAPYHPINASWDNTGDSKVFRVNDLRCISLKSFHDKVVPQQYLRSSFAQRLRLLQGLMDSDGAISDRKGQSIYCSTEKALAESVSEVLWSLGVKNAISEAESTQRLDWALRSAECGRVATGETLYYVKFTAFDDLKISCLDRKQSRAVPRNNETRSHFRYIDRIEPIPNPGMQCIQVDSPSHLFLVGRSFLPTHNSELAAAVALYLLCADFEQSAEVYGCAADRQQGAIVFDTSMQMSKMCPSLMKRMKILAATKRLVYLPTNSFYQVLSAEAYTKQGYSVHGLIFDEIHAQPDRRLFDTMTKGSGDARNAPLFFLITTAGTDTNSICYELHSKALDILDGRKNDSTFYPVIYAAQPEDDWTDPEVWKKANPSLGITVALEKMQAACESAKQNPAEENSFKTLRLNIWCKQSIRWMPVHVWDACADPVDPDDLLGRVCYGGLDLSSTTDLTAFVLVFPPRNESEKYMVLPYFWLPEETIGLRVRRDHVPYDLWQRQGFLKTTEGNVVHYAFIEKFIEELTKRYNIRETAYDRWSATSVVQNLEGEGMVMIPFGQGFKSMSAPTNDLMRLTLSKQIAHSGHPVLRWNVDNIFIRTDPAGNIKIDKEKSTERVDGAVALVMALDRAIKCGAGKPAGSIYDDGSGILFI